MPLSRGEGRWRCGYYTHKRVAHQRKCLVEKPKKIKKKKIRWGKKNSISLILWPVCLERPRECIQDAGFGHFSSVAWMYSIEPTYYQRPVAVRFSFLFRWLIGIRLSPFVYDRFDHIFSTFYFCIRVWPQYFQQFVTLAIESRSWVFFLNLNDSTAISISQMCSVAINKVAIRQGNELEQKALPSPAQRIWWPCHDLFFSFFLMWADYELVENLTWK